MPDLRPVLFIIGLMIIGLGAVMIIPMCVDIYYGNEDWHVFGISGIVSILLGGTLSLSTHMPGNYMRARGAFLLTTSSWLILALIGALPFILQDHGMSFTDAYFETMSGLTTTGSTVMTGLDTAPEGILIWRAMMQWYGGIGIIVTALAILPRLKIGGMQLFATEWFDPLGKILPRAGQIAASIGVVYLLLTVICAACYSFTGIRVFDAICLAMTTVSTGGFANSDSSFSAYASQGGDIVASVFMVLAACPFAAFVLALRGRPSAIFTNSQIRFFIGLLVILICVMTLYILTSDHVSSSHPIRLAAFNVISILTGTGYSFGDYQLWGPFAVTIFFIIMFIGGCAGSTSCSIKIFRYQVALSALRVYLSKMRYPNKVDNVRYNGILLPETTVYAIMSFLFLFFMCYTLSATCLTFVGLDSITAMTAAATAITNVGPGLGEIVGPSGTFQPLPSSAKWILAVTMLAGRLEIIPVLVVMRPAFWKA